MARTRRQLAAMVGASLDRRRDPHDFYPTDPAHTRFLLANERVPRRVHEPACGDGALGELLEAAGIRVVATDLVDRGYGKGGVDFLKTTRRPPGVQALVTNPPYRLAFEFLVHALALGYRWIALIVRPTWFGGTTKRLVGVWWERPPSRAWYYPARVPIARGRRPVADDQSGFYEAVWLIWDRADPGTPGRVPLLFPRPGTVG